MSLPLNQTNAEALRIVTNTYYAYFNGTHASAADIQALEDLTSDLIKMTFAIKANNKQLTEDQ